MNKEEKEINYLSPDNDERASKPLPGPPYFYRCLQGEMEDTTFSNKSKFLKNNTPCNQQLNLGMVIGKSYKPKPKYQKKKLQTISKKDKPITLVDAVRETRLENIRKSKEKFQSRAI